MGGEREIGERERRERERERERQQAPTTLRCAHAHSLGYIGEGDQISFVGYECLPPPDISGNVTQFASHQALKLTTCGELTFVERVVFHRVATRVTSRDVHPGRSTNHYHSYAVSTHTAYSENKLCIHSYVTGFPRVRGRGA